MLTRLRKLSPVKFISLKDLTLKLVMLLALVATARAQTLHLLNLDTMHKHKSSYVFNQEEIIKQSRPGYDNPDVLAKAFPADRRLCVYKVLQEYIKRTKHLRSSRYLFISYIKPHQRASVHTISRWIRTIMHQSGIDVGKYKAHSVRAASAAKALQNSVPVEIIMKHAGWSQQSTFTKFYNKKVQHSVDVAEAILK